MNQFKHKETKTYVGKIFDVVGSNGNPGFGDWGPIKVHEVSNHTVYYSYFLLTSVQNLKSIGTFERAINNKVIVEKKN